MARKSKKAEEYVVKAIRGRRTLPDGKFEYLIHWDGYASEADSWEHQDNLDGCQLLRQQYDRQISSSNAGVLKRHQNFERTSLSRPSTEIEYPYSSDLLITKLDLDISSLALPVFEAYQELELYQVSSLGPRVSILPTSLLSAPTSFPEQLMLNDIYSKLEEEYIADREYLDINGRPVKLRPVKIFRHIKDPIARFQAAIHHALGPPIVVENNVDQEGPPDDFCYINESIRGENIPPFDPERLAGCSCNDCSSNSKAKRTTPSCICVQDNLPDGENEPPIAPYKVNGRLRTDRRMAIFECTDMCSCPRSCPMRVVQRGPQIPLKIFRCPDGRGWGVRTRINIPRGTFVIQYVGELITYLESQRRVLYEYDNNQRTYMFDLDFSTNPDPSLYTIDAYRFGNISHFLNHSCNPNLRVLPTYINVREITMEQLAFFTCRDIFAGEELTFDYRGRRPDMSDSDDDDDNAAVDASGRSRQKCLCGSRNCRKYVL